MEQRANEHFGISISCKVYKCVDKPFDKYVVMSEFVLERDRRFGPVQGIRDKLIQPKISKY